MKLVSFFDNVMVQTSLNMAQNYRTTKEQHYFCRSRVTLNPWISYTRMHQYTITFPLQVCPHKPWDRNGKMVGGHRIKGCRHDNSCWTCFFFTSGTLTFHNITQLWEKIAKKTQSILACLLRGKISLVSLAYRMYNTSVIIS